VPEWAAADTGLSRIALRVLVALCRYVDAKGLCYPSQSTIAKTMNVRRESVNRALKELMQRGYLQTSGQPRGSRGRMGALQYLVQYDVPPSFASWKDESTPARDAQRRNKRYQKKEATSPSTAHGDGTPCDERGSHRHEGADSNGVTSGDHTVLVTSGDHRSCDERGSHKQPIEQPKAEQPTIITPAATHVHAHEAAWQNDDDDGDEDRGDPVGNQVTQPALDPSVKGEGMLLAWARQDRDGRMDLFCRAYALDEEPRSRLFSEIGEGLVPEELYQEAITHYIELDESQSEKVGS
jgi:hypothetical protein